MCAYHTSFKHSYVFAKSLTSPNKLRSYELFSAVSEEELNKAIEEGVEPSTQQEGQSRTNTIQRTKY